MADRIERAPRETSRQETETRRALFPERPGKLPERVTAELERLAQGLQIDKNLLDEELIDNGVKFHAIADAVALATSRRDAAKDELKLTEAECAKSIREGLAKDGTKVTDTAVASMVLTHPDVRAASERLRARDEELGRLVALKESYHQRSYAIKDLVSLHLAAYFGTTGKTIRRDVDDAGGEQRREKIRREQTDNRLKRRDERR